MNFTTNNPEIIVHGGTMFSGKTSALLSDVRKCEIVGLRVGLFKPKFDDRYSDDEVVNHNGISSKATNVTHLIEIVRDIYMYDLQVICIDEFQFIDLGKDPEEFESFLVNIILKEGRKLIVSGLELDSDLKVFDNMKRILPYATSVYKHKSICLDCHEPAYTIFCKVEKNGQVLLGSDDIYIPVCPNCYFKRMEEREGN